MERREDMRFLRGRGEYVDDVAMPGLLYAVILRSSVAHGRLVSIDASAALQVPGVHSVITGADMHGGPPIIPMRLQPLPEFKPFEQPVIAHDKVRYVGEPIAVVLASSVAIGEDALEVIEVEIEDLPPVADWQTASANKSVLFETQATNRSLVFQARKGDADAAFASAPYVRREHLRTGRHFGLTMEPRGVMATWDDADGKLTIYGAAKVPFFNRRILSAQIGLPGRADRDDRERRRRRLRRARRVLPRGFPDSVRGPPRQAPGEMDRGPPRKPDGDEPRPRGGVRPRGRLRARRHHPGDPRRGPHRHGRLYADQRRGRRAQRLAVHGRAVPRAARQDRLVALDDQQDAGRHLSRAGPLRGELLPRAHDRHDRRRSRHRPHRIPPQEPDQEQRAALSDRPCAADRRQGRIRQRRIFRDARPRAAGDRLAKYLQAPG